MPGQQAHPSEQPHTAATSLLASPCSGACAGTGMAPPGQETTHRGQSANAAQRSIPGIDGAPDFDDSQTSMGR
eukprot:7990342-Alexandrium_andersonii.AAC.1